MFAGLNSKGTAIINADDQFVSLWTGLAGSHKKIGWQQFTDEVIKTLSAKKEGLVFLLWGNFAKAKKALIDETKHYVLESVHPSPLAGGAFIGNGHFSKTNELLKAQGLEPIDWTL